MFLTIVANVLAFSLGAIFLGRHDVSGGVTVFVVTGLTGTILSSMIEAYTKFLLTSRVQLRTRKPRPGFREAPKPLPTTTGSP